MNYKISAAPAAEVQKKIPQRPRSFARELITCRPL